MACGRALALRGSFPPDHERGRRQVAASGTRNLPSGRLENKAVVVDLSSIYPARASLRGVLTHISCEN